MKKQLFYILASTAMLSSCHIYSNYERPANLPTDSLYRDTASVEAAMQATDTINFGNTPWREVFTDPKLQSLIEEALANNTDMRTAALSVQQAEAGLMTSRLAFFPSLSFSPTGTISKVEGNAATKSYTIPLQASWQVAQRKEDGRSIPAGNKGLSAGHTNADYCFRGQYVLHLVDAG